MRIAIAGAGYTGLAAAYDLAGAGHEVTLFEAADGAGGLARGFRDPRWSWPLERFYHHLFTNDDAIIGLCNEIGIGDRLTTYAPSTDLVHEGRPYPFDSPVAVLRYPGLSLLEKLRAGSAVGYMKLNRRWEPFDHVTAHRWLGRWMGGAYTKAFEGLLRGKFGADYYRDVPMTWFWARIFKRTPRLIYPDGGFETITDALVRAVTGRGAEIRLSAPVERLERLGDGGWRLHAAGSSARFDRVIATVSPTLLARLAPELPDDYLAALRALRSLGALVMTVALERPLTERSYWLNLDKREYPMLALVEHTNMVPPEHYGGDHLLYLGDYLSPDHPYLDYTPEQLLDLYEPALRRFNPDYERGWVRDRWLFSTRYAQPVPTLGYGARVPSLATPLDGLYLASMSQVYPWDRGTNYAVELGRRVAATIASNPRGIGDRVALPASA